MGLNLDVPEKCMGSYKSAQEKARVTVSRIVRGLTCLLVDIARVPLTNPRNQRGCSMAMMERIKGICLKPKTEWEVIAGEETSAADLFKRYAVPLAAIPPIAGFIGGSLIGRSMPFVGSYRVPMVSGLVMAVSMFVMALVGVYVISLIINYLAPSFGAQKDSGQALKVAVYSYTPAWVAGVLQILPTLGLLAVLAGLYGLYLLYLGLPRLMKCPQEKAVGYTAVVVVCAIILSIIVGAVGAGIMGAGMFGARGVPGLAGGRGSSVEFDKDSPMGKLQAMGKALEANNKQMEAAKKSGDPNAQAAAAMAGLGAVLGGGKKVDPIGIDQLKPFIPESFAGLAKLSSNAEKTGAMGMMVSKAQAKYGDRAQKNVSLDISDAGGASGLLGMAGWMGIQGEREDDNGFERTKNENGRLIHEKGSKRPEGGNEFTIVLGGRFIVSAKGHGIDLAALKTAVSDLDLAKLEGMKNMGVQK